MYDNFNAQNEHFLSRGHLTPNADFTDATDREMTMVNTNIAPQWQRFNAKNWATLEAAVRAYATAVNRNIYVFTGVCKYIAWTTPFYDDQKYQEKSGILNL